MCSSVREDVCGTLRIALGFLSGCVLVGEAMSTTTSPPPSPSIVLAAKHEEQGAVPPRKTPVLTPLMRKPNGTR
jgi:hypothetical protein